MPKISVVITSYNQKDYLREAVASILKQTLKPHEIIIVDDCSTDGSKDVIDAYVQAYPGFIRAFYQPKNVGFARNKNYGIRQVRGECKLGDTDALML